MPSIGTKLLARVKKIYSFDSILAIIWLPSELLHLHPLVSDLTIIFLEVSPSEKKKQSPLKGVTMWKAGNRQREALNAKS